MLYLGHGTPCYHGTRKRCIIVLQAVINLMYLNYPFQACLKSCYQSHVMSECNCIDPTVPSKGAAVTKLMSNPTMEIEPCHTTIESKGPVHTSQNIFNYITITNDKYITILQ